MLGCFLNSLTGFSAGGAWEAQCFPQGTLTQLSSYVWD